MKLHAQGKQSVRLQDLNDHDQLRHDPLLAGKLAARRSDCAPVAGKSTLNRLELSRPTPSLYHKISHDEAASSSPFLSHGGRSSGPEALCGQFSRGSACSHTELGAHKDNMGAHKGPVV
jgi:hypothetical protein